MFYCEECREKKGWPEGVAMSGGACEICGQRKTCYDVPSTHLPRPKTGLTPEQTTELIDWQARHIVDLREALYSLQRGIGCWCEKSIGNPMVSIGNPMVSIGNPMVKEHAPQCRLADRVMRVSPPAIDTKTGEWANVRHRSYIIAEVERDG